MPLLGGMAATFAVVAGLATYAGGWVVRANQIGRWIAVVVFAVMGLALLLPNFAEFLSRPFVRLGGHVQGQNASQSHQAPSVGRSLLLGVSTGLLWAPCAGPILGLILAGAALQGPSAHTTFLLLAFAAGAASSLALALLAGNKVFAAMKRSLGSGGVDSTRAWCGGADWSRGDFVWVGYGNLAAAFADEHFGH